VLSMVSWMA